MKHSKSSDILSLYSIKELRTELINRIKARAIRKMRPLQATKGLRSQIKLKALRDEIEFFVHIDPKGRPNMYELDGIDPEERLLEKMWWWIIDNKRIRTKGWVNHWLEKNPAEIGISNVSNRENWLEGRLKKIPKGKKILDAGAGELQYKRFCKHLDYTSQDFAQYNGEGNSEGLQAGTWDNSKLDIISDIVDIPVNDKSFDAIMCVEVFEHIPKPINAIKEFSRILKPGGTLIITAPFACLTHFAPYFFYNGYSRYFYEKLLSEYSFEIKEINYNGNYFEYLGQELNRLDDVANTYVPKKSKPTNTENLSRQLILKRLEKLSKNDTGSHELLVHGINVIAIKK